MTNEQIIYNAQKALAEAGEIGFGPQYGIEQLEPIHTFQTWKDLGFSVKRGQHAVCKLSIWKYPSYRRTEEDGTVTITEPIDGHCFLKQSFFFALHQVERITK